jgi:saccharopine dehydrogenase (NAD+, L-lysine forming)
MSYFASYFAGYTGAALAVKTWAWQLAHPGEPLPGVKTFTQGRGYYLNEEELLNQIKEDVAIGEKISGRKPTLMVLGAMGRCGTGACDLATKAGLPEKNITRWDLNETKDRHGPYEEIIQHDIFLNAVGIVVDKSDRRANKTYRSISRIQSRLLSITIF